MFCSRRCRCLSDLRIRTEIPARTSTEIPAPEVLADEATPHLPYDINPVFPLTALSTIRIDYLKEREETDQAITATELITFVVAAQEEATIPRCGDGPPASWNLPRPFFWLLFENLTQVCLAQTHGGSIFGNAGFVCEGRGRRAELTPKEWLAQ